MKCSICYGDLASGGLTLTTFAELMQGGGSGPAVVPGDAANSVLFQVQSAGCHFANLTPKELEIVQQWIADGAPER